MSLVLLLLLVLVLLAVAATVRAWTRDERPAHLGSPRSHPGEEEVRR